MTGIEMEVMTPKEAAQRDLVGPLLQLLNRGGIFSGIAAFYTQQTLLTALASGEIIPILRLGSGKEEKILIGAARLFVEDAANGYIDFVPVFKKDTKPEQIVEALKKLKEFSIVRKNASRISIRVLASPEELDPLLDGSGFVPDVPLKKYFRTLNGYKDGVMCTALAMGLGTIEPFAAPVDETKYLSEISDLKMVLEKYKEDLAEKDTVIAGLSEKNKGLEKSLEEARKKITDLENFAKIAGDAEKVLTEEDKEIEETKKKDPYLEAVWQEAEKNAAEDESAPATEKPLKTSGEEKLGVYERKILEIIIRHREGFFQKDLTKQASLKSLCENSSTLQVGISKAVISLNEKRCLIDKEPKGNTNLLTPKMEEIKARFPDLAPQEASTQEIKEEVKSADSQPVAEVGYTKQDHDKDKKEAPKARENCGIGNSGDNGEKQDQVGEKKTSEGSLPHEEKSDDTKNMKPYDIVKKIILEYPGSKIIHKDLWDKARELGLREEDLEKVKRALGILAVAVQGIIRDHKADSWEDGFVEIIKRP